MPSTRLTTADRDPRAPQSRWLIDAIARDMRWRYGWRVATARETVEMHLGRIVAEARAAERAGTSPRGRTRRA